MPYNYENFSAADYDLSNFRGPAPGDKALDFDLTDPDGAPRRLLDFSGDFLVLELGSVTCPLFQSRRGGMAKTMAKHQNSSFAILYVREAHPGTSIKQHQSQDDKNACARQVRDDNEARAIIVDDIEGHAHKAYGEYPNAVFIINRHGCVVFLSDWNDWRAVDKALDQLENGKAASVRSFFRPPLPPVAVGTLGRSGKGAVPDFLKSLPTLIWKNLIMRNLRVLMGKQNDVASDARC